MTIEGKRKKGKEEGSGEGGEVKRSNVIQQFVTAPHISHITSYGQHVPFVSYRVVAYTT